MSQMLIDSCRKTELIKLNWKGFIVFWLANAPLEFLDLWTYILLETPLHKKLRTKKGVGTKYSSTLFRSDDHPVA